jgi:hypothetical protein
MSFSRSALLALCLGAIGASVAVSQTGPPPASKAAAASSRSPGRALVVVNGRNITDRELEQLLAARQAGDAVAAEVRKRFLEQSIDARLIGEFLASRKTTATRQEIDAELDALRTAAKRQGNDPDRTLAAVGYPLEFLREEIGRRLAWRKHVDRTISPERLTARRSARARFSERSKPRRPKRNGSRRKTCSLNCGSGSTPAGSALPRRRRNILRLRLKTREETSAIFRMRGACPRSSHGRRSG